MATLHSQLESKSHHEFGPSRLIFSLAVGLLLAVTSGVAPAEAASSPSITSIVKGPDGSAAPVAPGSFAILRGSLLAPSGVVAKTPYPTTLNGATLSVNGRLAPLSYVSATEIGFQVPYETIAGTAKVVVTKSGVALNPAYVSVVAAAPALYFQITNNAPGKGVNSAGSPAAPGNSVEVTFTGLGAVSPFVADGAAAPASPLSTSALAVSAAVNGISVTPGGVSLKPGTAMQAQASIPIPATLPTGAYPLTITVNGVTSAAGRVYVQAVTTGGTQNTGLTITTTSLPVGTLNTAYGPTTLAATGGSGTYRWSVVTPSSFPPGLSLSTAGVLSGTPTKAGRYPSSAIKVTDTVSGTSSQHSYVITVQSSVTIVTGHQGSNPSTTSLGSISSPVTFGSAVTLNATVSATSLATGDTVTFYDGTSILGIGSLVNGSASLQTKLLATGAHKLTARYSGNASTLSSISSPVSLTVNTNPQGTYGGFSSYILGTAPAAGVVADFNGDGYEDIAYAASQSVTVLLGDGTGAFTTSSSTQIPYSNALAVGDFNGDGVPDLAAANATGSTVSILLGNRDGTFTYAAGPALNGSQNNVAVADFNGDGIADIVVTDAGSDSNPAVEVMLGNGDGTFQSPSATLSLSSVIFPQGLAIGDFNGDGKPDIVYSDGYGSAVGVALGNGDGTFGSFVNYTVGGYPTVVAVADLNGDGKSDLVVANSNDNTVSVLLGNGDGTFQSQAVYASGWVPAGIGIADVNNDGYPDLVVSNPSAPSLTILLGQSGGTFASGPTITSFPAGAVPAGVAIGDFNGDGRPDIVVSDQNTYPKVPTTEIFFGRAPAAISLSSGTNPSTYGVTNLTLTATVTNGTTGDKVTFFDGVTPLATELLSGTTATLSTKLLGTGIHKLTAEYLGNLIVAPGTSGVVTQTVNPLPESGFGSVSTNSLSGSTPKTIIAGDFNGDGKADLAVSTTTGFSILLGNGTGAISSNTANSASSPPAMAAGDFNGDGITDLVLAFAGDGAFIDTYLGRGDGTFPTSASTNSSAGTPTSFAVADFNGDGIPDVAATLAGRTNFAVYPGNGDGTFGVYIAGPALSGTIVNTIAAADFNGDGKPDLVYAFGTNSVGVSLGNGDGTFAEPNTLTAGNGPVFVTAADLNGDGYMDVAVANQTDGTVSVFLGNGDGTFQNPATYSAGANPVWITVADVNDDSRPDLIVANNASGSNIVTLLGRSGGTFVAGPTFSGGTGPVAVATADFNGDGRPDLAVADATGTQANIILGQLPQPSVSCPFTPPILTGTSYSTTCVGSGSVSPYSFHFLTGTGSTPPPGLTLNASSGLISGTPSTAGSYTFTVQVTDSDSPAQTAGTQYTVNVYGPITFTTTTLPTGALSTTYTSTQLAATGGTGSYTWAATGLPTGLSISSSGLLSGTPTQAGTFNNVQITATDSGAGLSKTVTFTLTVNGAVSITTSSLHSGIVNAAYSSVQFAASGGSGTYSWAATGLPAGLSLSGAGVLSGTPTAAGTSSSVQVTVTDTVSTLTATVTYSITIYNPLVITTTVPLPNGNSLTVPQDTAYGIIFTTSTTTTATSSDINFYNSFVSSAATSNSNLAALGATWKAIGSTATVNAIDNLGNSNNIPIYNIAGQLVANGNQDLFNLSLQHPIGYDQNGSILQSSTFTANSVSVTAQGPIWTGTGAAAHDAYPGQGIPGQQLGATSGVATYGASCPPGSPTCFPNSTDPTTSGLWTALWNDTLTTAHPMYGVGYVAAANPVLPVGTTTVSYTPTTLSFAGGSGTATWSATGLPAGLSLSTAGVLTGTPTAAGSSSNVLVTVTDSVTSQTSTARYSINIYGPLSISTSTLPAGTINVGYSSTTLAASGGSGSVTWSATGLPSGLTLSTAGVLSGTPTATGTFTSVQVTATDATAGQTASKTFTISVYNPLSITTASPLPIGRTTVAYTSTTLAASGGSGSISWSATGLPAGLSLSTAGVLTGTPTAAGTSSNVQVTVLDSVTGLSASKTFSISIYVPLSITTSSLPAGSTALAYTSTTLAVTGGSGSVSWSATGLPPGLTLSTGGLLSGTPTATGTYSSVQVTASDTTASQNALATFSITIYSAPGITTSSLPPGINGGTYSPYTLTASGGSASYSWSATGLPTGLSLSTAGVLSGGPTQLGTFSSVVVTLTDTVTGAVATKTLSITVYPPLSITTSSVPSGVVGTAYTSTQLSATGASGSYTWTSGTLPAGLTLSSSGLLSGTPTAAGTFSSIQFSVSDPASPNAAGIFFTIVIYNPLSITTSTLPAGTVNVAYSSTTLAKSGGSGTATWAATGLPTGLSLSSAGVLSGTPAVTGTFNNVQITLTDSTAGLTANATLSVSVYSPLSITTASPLPLGTRTVAYTSTTFAATGGSGTVTWAATGLPAGLSLSTAGVLTGTPTAAGTSSNVQVTVTDTITTLTASKTYSITIYNPLAITTSSLPVGLANTAYTTTTLASSGGSGSVTWSGTGLPPGLTLSTAGVLSGTPTSAASWSNVQITATDATAGLTATAPFTINVFIPLSINTSSLPAGTINVAYPATTLAAGGGSGTVTWAATGLPPGLSLSTAGVLSGTPTATGTYANAQITVTDTTAGQNVSKTFTISIYNPMSITTTSPLPLGTVTVAYTPTTLAVTGGSGTVTWAATGLPAGLSLSTAGVLTGTPTAAGTSSNIQVTVTDTVTTLTASKTYSITVYNPLTITTSSLPVGTTTIAYTSTTLAATGGSGTVTWAATGLPAGLSLSTAGVLTGTPGAAGTSSNVQVTVTDTVTTLTASKTFTITIYSPMSITTASPLPLGTRTVAYTSTTFAATGGSGTATWAATGLPAGLSLSTAGVLTGTPTAAGTSSNIQVTVTDTITTLTASKTYSITIYNPLAITTSSLPVGIANTTYTTTTLTASGGSGSVTWSATGLPPGLTLSTAGVLSGTPTSAASWSNVQITATDATAGLTATAPFTINVFFPLSINTSSLPAGTINVAYPATTLAAGGGSGTVTWAATGLPPGLSLSTAGVLSGTPTATGTYANAQITVTDTTAGQNVSKTFTISIYNPMSITTTSPLPLGTVTVAYTPTTLAVTGGSGTVTWAATGLPAGLSLSTAGVLTGTPTAAGTSSNIQVTVTDTVTTLTASKTYSITVYNPLTITTSSLPVGTTTIAYTSTTLAATGGSGTVTWAATGLPAGLSLSTSGVLTGTPTAAGTSSNIQVTVTDSVTTLSATKTYSITIYNPLSITTASPLPVGTTTVAYTATTLAATGGSGTVTWAATGLPAGLSLSTAGVLTGTPTAAGTSSNIQVTVTDSVTTLSATKTYSITIYNPLSITTASPLPVGTTTVAYTATTLTATGGSGTVTWAATGLPAGLSLSTAGVLTGTPTAAGTSSNIQVTVTDTITTLSATKTYSITIYNPLSITTASPLPVGTTTVAYTATTLTATGGSGTVTWAATGLPAGLSLSTAGVLTGTPTAAGTSSNIQVTVTDSVTTLSASKTYSITIYNPLSITTASPLPVGTTTVAYTATTLAATGGSGTVTWAATGLPAGLSLSNAGVLTGTPTAAGTSSNIQVTVTDSVTTLSATKTYSITIYNPLSITTASPLPVGTTTVAYTATTLAATGGSGTVTWAATGLPAGLSLSTAGVLTGTPTAAGNSSNIQVTVTDSVTTLTASKTYSITIYNPLSITTASPLPVGTTTVAYTATTLAATGGSGTVTWAATGLPAGLSLSTAGVLTGTPTAAGTSSNIQVTVIDTITTLTASKTYSITIYNPLSITTASPLPVGTTTVAYTATTLAATGGSGTVTWAATGLPTGLSLSTAGVLTGTPTAAGTSSNIQVTVTDSVTTLSATKTYSITIYNPLSITTASPLPVGTTTVAYTATTLAATGGSGTVTWAATGLPAGLSLSTAGVLTGTPTAAGTSSNIQVTVTDTITTLSASKTYSITVYNPLSITTASPLPVGTTTVAYTATTLAATGGSGTVTWAATGLPGGLSLSTAGVLTGTPTAAGTSSNIQVTVTDSVTTLSATKTYSIAVYTPLSITTSSLPGGTTNSAYTPVAMQATGGSGTYAWSATGLPGGLTISSTGSISGTPTLTGSFSVNVTVADTTAAQTTSQTFQLSIQAAAVPLSISGPASLGGIALGGSVSGSWTAAGGKSPYTWAAPGLPAGLTVGYTTGAVSGTPAAPGNYSFQIQVFDSTGASRSQAVTFNVLGITTGSLPSGNVNQSYSASVGATGGSGSNTYSGGGLPAGLSLSPSGLISGKPTASGKFSVSVTATDSAGLSASASLALTINPSSPLTITSSSLPDGTVSQPYSQNLGASGGVGPYTWSQTGGALPAGLNLNSAGTVAGVPTAGGLSSFTVQATDTAGATALVTISINIAPLPLQISASLPNGVTNVDYPPQILSAAGGIQPYTYAIQGSLPDGLTLSNGVIAGNPGVSGTFPVTLLVTDSTGVTAHLATSVTIRAQSADLILSSSAVSFAISSGSTALPAPNAVTVRSSDVTKVIAYTTTFSAASWLSVTAGSATPSGLSISLTAAALSLAASTTPYTATITLTCAAGSPCEGKSQSVAVSLVVNALPPQLSLSTSLLAFSATGASPGSSSQSLGIQNTGGGVLTITSVTAADGWVKVGAYPTSLAGNVSASVAITANPAGLPPGYYRSTVTVASSAGNASVVVTMLVSPNAVMTLGPSGAQYSMSAGGALGNPSGSFLVAVSGSTPISWSAAVLPGSPWLILNSGSGSATSAAPSTVSFSIDPAAAAALAPGAYYGTIEVNAPGVFNSTQDFQVVLSVSLAAAPAQPDPEPAGLIFLTSGSTLPPQTVRLYASSTAAVPYQASASTSDGANWLSVSPATGSTQAGLPPFRRFPSTPADCSPASTAGASATPSLPPPFAP